MPTQQLMLPLVLRVPFGVAVAWEKLPPERQAALTQDMLTVLLPQMCPEQGPRLAAFLAACRHRAAKEYTP